MKFRNSWHIWLSCRTEAMVIAAWVSAGAGPLLCGAFISEQKPALTVSSSCICWVKQRWGITWSLALIFSSQTANCLSLHHIFTFSYTKLGKAACLMGITVLLAVCPPMAATNQLLRWIFASLREILCLCFGPLCQCNALRSSLLHSSCEGQSLNVGSWLQVPEGLPSIIVKSMPHGVHVRMLILNWFLLVFNIMKDGRAKCETQCWFEIFT